MKYRFLLFLCALLWGITSCYDDKGNYDYTPVNEISIRFPSDFSFQQVIGDTVKLQPVLSYSLDSTDLNLSFEWSFAGKVVCRERNLKWVLDTSVQSNLILRVTDQDNGLVYLQSTIVRPTSLYTAPKSYLVLSEKDNQSILTFLQQEYLRDENGNYLRDENGDYRIGYKIYEDFYQKENKEKLGSSPLFMQEHIADIFPSEGHLTVFQGGGQRDVDLDGISMKKDILLQQAFIGGSYPAGYDPVNAVFMTWIHLIENKDGLLYSRIKETRELFQSGYFIHTPLLYDQKEIHGHLIDVNVREKPFCLIHETGTTDRPENRLLLIHDLKDTYEDINVVGKIVSLKTPKHGWPDHFVPLDDLGENQLIYTGHYSAGYWEEEAGFCMILKDKAGKYIYQTFEIERESDGEITYMANEEGTGEKLQVHELPSVLPYEDCLFANIAVAENPYLFIAYGKDIYFIDRSSFSNGVRHYYTCPSAVVALDGRASYGETLMVGLENGSLLHLNIEGAKNIQSDSRKLKWTSPAGVNLGRIVDLRRKSGGYVS